MYQYILVIFLHKAYSKVDFVHVKILEAIFVGQSLLLSTTILDDSYCITTFLRAKISKIKNIILCKNANFQGLAYFGCKCLASFDNLRNKFWRLDEKP